MADIGFYIVLVLVLFACDGGVIANRIFLELTTPANATEKGAVCLDGSEPAYQHDIGYGDGSNSWTIHLEGGGWCLTNTSCVDQINNPSGLGSRSRMKRDNLGYGGIQSQDMLVNPDFYNWNKVYVRYCDGASFLADVEEPRKIKNTTIYFRGARIFQATIEDLLERGMKNANNVLFSGNSAGGLANLLNCDNFRALVPYDIPVKCVADSSFFIHAKDLPGLERREGAFFNLIETHELTNRLPKSCTSRMQDPRLCIFPEYFVEDIQTPLFMVQSAYDSYQIQFLIQHDESADWSNCYYHGEANCTPCELKNMKDFGTTLVESFPKFQFSENGFFVDSCACHDEIAGDKWNHAPEVILNNKTIAQAVGEWFFDQYPFRVINKTDFPFNCSTTK